MNERQRKKFELQFCKSPSTVEFCSPLETAKHFYSAACQDEAERAQGLVRALEQISIGNSTPESIALDALAAFKGDAK